jgi:hypothetical protein
MTDERKVYFSLIIHKPVFLTEDEFLEKNLAYVSLGKWEKFCKDYDSQIREAVIQHDTCFTVNTNNGVASYNSYDCYVCAYRAAAVNLYLELRCLNLI